MKPAVDYNWFDTGFDQRLLALAAQRIQKIVSTPPLSNFISGGKHQSLHSQRCGSLNPVARLRPSADIGTIQSFENYVLSSSFGANHPVGSALMGTCLKVIRLIVSDNHLFHSAPRGIGGVVDSNLKVYGTSNVYVVDASVIPVEPVGHTQATVYAIAERAAQLFIK